MPQNGQIQGPDVIADDVLSRIAQLNDSLEKTILTLNKVETAAKNAFNTGQLNSQASQANQINTQANETLRERTRLETALARQTERNRQITSQTNRELVRQRVITQEQTRNIKRQETANNSLVGAYRRLSAQLNIAKELYKDLAVEQGANSAAARRQAVEVQRLQTRVRAADQAVGDFQRNVGNYPTALRPAIGVIRQLIGAFGLVEGFRLTKDLIQDSIELANQARGVEFAFDRLGDRGVRAFEDIRRATRGALSDLDIKTAINEFENFNLNLEESGVLFEFLTVRSRQTGKSIEELQSSLVEGLSKQSKLRIDNLGISVIALNDELEKTPDFVEAVANIARKELAEAGDIIDAAANSQERLNASIENAKVSFGQLLQSSNLGFLGALSNQIDRIDQGFKSLRESLARVRLGFENFVRPINDLLERFPRLKSFVDGAVNSFAAFINLVTTPGIEVFAGALTTIGAVASGIGSSFGAARNAVADFLENLKTLSDIEFSLDPIETIKSAREVFGRIGTSIKRGGEEIGNAFMEGYNSVINFEPDDTDILKPIENLSKEAEAARPKIEKVVDELERGYRAAENMLRAFQKTFDLDPKNLIQSISQDELTKGLESIAESFVKTERSAEENAAALKEIYAGVFDNFSNQYGIDFSGFSALLQDKENKFEDYAATANSISDAIFLGQANRYEAEIQQNRDALNQILNDDRASEAQKLAAREKAQKREQELRIKQAKAERQATLVRIAVDTAQGIVSALAQVPKFDFGISATALAATIAAIGAAQAAFVAAQPLPQFFLGKGLHNHYQGLATWGEAGREVRVGKDGRLEVSPATTTPTYVNRDDLILKNIPLFKQQMQNPSSEVYKRVSSAWRSDTKERQMIVAPPTFNGKALEKTIDKGLKKGFKGIDHKINIINRVEQRRVTRY